MSPHTLFEVAELDALPAAVRTLFEHRYRSAAPDFPHHVVASVAGSGAGQPLCYVHFSDFGEVLLGGGACVDQRRLRRVAPELRNALRAAGGAYRATLDWAVRHFAPRYPAIFGYCGDPLAERIDLAAGFVKTDFPHLLVHWTRPLDAAEQSRLIGIAHAFGPF
ncbi:MAG: hypothetical protein AB7V26_08665 [Lysobacterales bacterium]